MTTGYQALPQWLEARGAHARVAVRRGAWTLPYGPLLRLVAATAQHLGTAGVAPGDRVVLVFPNGLEHLVALLAVTGLGATAVPLDPAAGARRLARVIAETGPAQILGPARAPADRGVPVTTLQLDLQRFAVRLGERVLQADLARELPESPASSALALIRYSSGSTGEPKGALLSHHQMHWTAATLSRLYGIGPAHRELILAPMTHSGAWQRVAATLVGGGCVVFNDEMLSVTAVLDAIMENEVTGWFAPPPMVRMLLKAPAERVRAALTSCRSLEIGSGPVSASELAAMRELCPQATLFVHYGLTECSRAFVLDTRRHPDKLNTVGRPAPGVEVDIRDEAGRSLAAGETGDIYLRGPQMAQSYWQKDHLTRPTSTDGWLATGDLGVLDQDGFLSVRGRRDDRICSGGFSFFPTEVESELGPVDGVAQYMILGMPDDAGQLGEVPWALVVPQHPGTWTAREFRAIARRALPAHMVPRRIIAVSELPVTPSGKPDRPRARKLFDEP